MAFGARQIYPNDLRPRVAIGFDLPINGEGVFNSNYQTRDAIKNNLINYLLTNPGERPANPTFGAGLRRFIFTQIENDNLDFIREDLQDKINQNFPNVLLNNVEILSSPNQNQITIKIYYSIPNTGINDQLELSFS